MKWLLQDMGPRAGLAIRNPRYALNAVVRELTFADERFLARLTGSSPRQIRMYLDELLNTPAFAAHLRHEEEHFRSLSIESANLFAKKVLNRCAAVRAIADCIVETNEANCISSSYLLLPLHKNEDGCAPCRSCRHGIPSSGERSLLACSSPATRRLAGSLG